MTGRERQPGFPLWSSAVLLTAVAVMVYAASWTIVAHWFAQVQGAQAAVSTMSAVVWVSSLLGVLPVAILGRRGVFPTVVGYFVGAGIRIVLCLAAAVIAAKGYGLPLAMTMISMVVMYQPLLFVETACVGRYLCRKDHLPKSPDATADDRWQRAEATL